MNTKYQYNVVVNPAEQERLESELQLVSPCHVTIVLEAHIRHEDHATFETFGDYQYVTREIRLMVGATWLSRTAPSLVRSRMARTLLHEFRHAHQYDYWPRHKISDAHAVHYGMSPMEQDANDFADLRGAAYSNLVKLSFKRPSSYDFGHGPRGFAKLSAVGQ